MICFTFDQQFSISHDLGNPYPAYLSKIRCVRPVYDSEGERQHTIYLGAAPEYGKKSFLERLERGNLEKKILLTKSWSRQGKRILSE
jgi:hypothetical protein